MNVFESKHAEDLLVATIEGVLDQELLKSKLTLFKNDIEERNKRPWFNIDTTSVDVASIVTGSIVLLIFFTLIVLFYFKINPENNKFIADAAKACSSGKTVECSGFYALEDNYYKKKDLLNLYYKATNKSLFNESNKDILKSIPRDEIKSYLRDE